MTEAKKDSRKTVDWEPVERDYRAGVLSIREIGRLHGVSDKAIRNKAKEERWQRDLSSKVNELVRAELVRTESAPADKQTEREIIEVAAATVVQVVRSHRTSIKRGSDLLARMMAEIEQITDSPEQFERLFELMVDTADESADRILKLKQAFDRVMSSPGRIDSLKKLVETMKMLIALERQAFNIADTTDPGKERDLSPEERLARIDKLSAKLKTAKEVG